MKPGVLLSCYFMANVATGTGLGSGSGPAGWLVHRNMRLENNVYPMIAQVKEFDGWINQGIKSGNMYTSGELLAELVRSLDEYITSLTTDSTNIDQEDTTFKPPLKQLGAINETQNFDFYMKKVLTILQPLSEKKGPLTKSSAETSLKAIKKLLQKQDLTSYHLMSDTNGEQQSLLDYLTSYGKWCGGNHGGYQDCCEDEACNECDAAFTGTGYGSAPTSPSKKCLDQCPPVDGVDYICAIHDRCTFHNKHPNQFSCEPQGNYCQCDCELLKHIAEASCSSWYCSFYKFGMYAVFTEQTACWFKPQVSTWTSVKRIFQEADPDRDLVCLNAGYGERSWFC